MQVSGTCAFDAAHRGRQATRDVETFRFAAASNAFRTFACPEDMTGTGRLQPSDHRSSVHCLRGART
ncbi:hypothetical protein CBM2626_B60091 [Cupriavidus taiwanensis]|nr:hypothetical protein CBM2626_B60091 [Cupriavidus taiwanensis]